MQTTTKDYPVATIGKRIGINIANYLLLGILGMLVNFLILYFPFDWNVITNDSELPYNNILFSGLFTLCMVINGLLWFLLFILVPYWADGKTFGSCMTKCKLYCEEESHRFKSIMDHQGVFILPILFTMFLSSLVSFAFKDPAQFISSIFGFNPGGVSGTAEQAASGVMFVLFIISCIILCGNIINVCLNRNTSSLLDDQFKVYLIDYSEDTAKPSIIKKDKHDLPGKIDMEELDKL